MVISFSGLKYICLTAMIWPVVGLRYVDTEPYEPELTTFVTFADQDTFDQVSEFFLEVLFVLFVESD